MGDKITWKERLEAIPPQKSIAALLREVKAIGIKISDKGLRKQNDRHGILVQADGMVSIRVDTVLSLELWKTVDGDAVVDAQAATSGAIAQYNADRAREMKAKANIKEREDLVEAGELIHKDQLNKMVLAPAIVLQRNILSSVDKKSEEILDMVGGDTGKVSAVALELRRWLKKELALAYADTVYQLSIDPVRMPVQTTLIDD